MSDLSIDDLRKLRGILGVEPACKNHKVELLPCDLLNGPIVVGCKHCGYLSAMGPKIAKELGWIP